MKEKSGQKKSSRLKVDTTEPVRINKGIVGRVKAHKKNGGPAIGTFFEIAAKEKLDLIELREAEIVNGKSK